MNSLFPRASLKRSAHIRTRKNTISADTDVVCPPRSSTLARRKIRPPPLQIIPELSENELDINASPTHSPATARPTQQFVPQQPELESSRITLSAYTFSIDDTLLMLGDDAPRSPALSASSSTSDGASSEDVPTTPGTSDDEDGCSFMLPTPRLCPQRISIRPLCITKTRSLICQEDEDIHDYFEKAEAIPLPLTEEPPKHLTEARAATEAAQEAEQDFYTREFEDFISLSPVVASPTSPARRDSLIIAAETLPIAIEVPEPKPRGRSRHSKPLPLLPHTTPPASSFPLIPTFPLMQTTAQKSIVRRKRNMPLLPNYPPPLPVESRPLPRMAVPLDIEDCTFLEENFDVPPRGTIVIEQVYDAAEDASIYSQSSFAYTPSASTRQLPPAISETCFAGTYGEVTLPRSSTDSDAPRSSIDSTSSPASSTSSNTPTSFTFPSSPSSECHEPESMQRLRSRWSSSTLASLDVEPPRTTTLFSPLKSVLGSRARRVPTQKVPPQMPPHPTPSKLPKNKLGFSTTPSPPSKHIRRQGSRSSTSSAGTSSSECDSRDGSPNGLKRKPIPVLMFLRAT